MNKPHDHLFKSTFSDPRIAADYIRNFLPTKLTSKLDLTSLKLAPGSYVNEELKEYLSDVVYRCKYGQEEIKSREGEMSLLFEHKSQPNGIIYLQLLRYLLEAWDQQPKKIEGLGIIIPIVVYHGKEKWQKRTFSSHFPSLDAILAPFIPSFQYLLTDLADWSDEALMTLQAGLVRNVLLVLKHFKETQYIKQHIDRLFWEAEPYLADPSQKQYIKILWNYIYGTNELSILEIRILGEKLSTSLRNEAMTTYEHAVQKGEKKGSIEQQNLVITNSYNEGLDIPFIARITGLSEAEVTDRIKELGLEK